MNKILLVLPLLGLTFAGCEKKNTPTVAEPTLADKAETAVKDAAEKTKEVAINAKDATKDAAINAKDAIGDKLTEWKLTPSDLKADLEKGGRVVRSKAASAGASTGAMIDNARVVTMVNSKIIADSGLSALKINVDADKGVVTLKGTVKSVDHIGRAIALALDTDGVTQVVSLLTVAP